MRALLFAAVPNPRAPGGLPRALADVADALRARGWDVETPTLSSPRLPATQRFSRLAPLQRSRLLSRLWQAIPRWLRRQISTLAAPAGYWQALSASLHALDELVAATDRFDVVMLSVDGSPPGCAAALATRGCPFVILTLEGLAQELGGWWPRWMRVVARLRAGPPHPFLFARIAAPDIPLAVCASRSWRDETIRAGAPGAVVETVYFGVPVRPDPPAVRPLSGQGRLLWVGRLSPEKGLHLLVEALPAIRRVAPVTLTVIAGGGSTGYRTRVMSRIRRLGLDDVVHVEPAVPRAALRAAYAEHDALFFHSMFAEPVALVLMEAFQAGLPVVSSPAEHAHGLVRDGVTCVTYRPDRIDSIADAVVRVLGDELLRRHLAANARRLVAEEYTLERMGEAYDRLLRAFVSARLGRRSCEDPSSSHGSPRVR